MLAKLSTITTLYRKFTKNQVLTEGHLNEIVDFFDDQDRLSRIGLSGVGIICGFQVSYNPGAKNISITQGKGITTDGDLLHLYNSTPNGGKIIDFESKQYTHYKVYDNKKAAYKPYFYKDGKQLEIFELLTAEQLIGESAPTFPIQYLKKNTGLEVTDAVVLLYIESYEKDSDLCVSLSCDNQGLEIIGNHKALLVNKDVAAQINRYDKIISQTSFSSLYYKLPELLANRIVLHPEDFTSYYEIKKKFTNGIFRNNILDRFREGFEVLLTELNMPVLLDSIKKNLAALYNFKENNVPPDFQYRYDLLNDLIDTYKEIRLLLSNMDGDFCCPDLKSFPKHLMLGEVSKTGPCFEYRHAFYKSPLLTGQNLSTCNDCLPFDTLNDLGKEEIINEFIVDLEGKETKICYGKNTDLQKLYSLIKRCAQLLANYNVNYNYIKITPSFELGSLGKKAIPFYNNVGNHLIELWDYEKTTIGQQRNNWSYHDNLLNTKRPFEVVADHTFYRIEGHQGTDYKKALKTIQSIRRELGLGFNVVVLGVKASEVKKKIEDFTSYYLNKNHGYEHKSGVTPGGTFVMIYIEGEYGEYPYYYGYGYPYEFPRGHSLAGDFEKEKGKKVPGESIVLNPVIADFSLPYLCCDDNFIALSLPMNHLCFDENTPYFPFHVTPTGGFVKADVDPGLNGGVTKNQYGEFVFDPKLVSKDLIGKPISFTVNNIETKCEITIYRKPKVDFTFVFPKSLNKGGVAVDFTITGENEKDIKYVWDFGDGTEPVATNDTKIQHIYLYEVPTKESYSFEVKVTAENGNCNAQAQHPVTFEVTNFTVGIDTKIICKNDLKPHILTIEPASKKAVLTGPGVSQNDSGDYIFIGNNVPKDLTEVVILINGEPSNLTIKMQNPPVALFKTAIRNNQIAFTNQSTDAVKYIWNIEEEVIETDSTEAIIRPTSLYKNDVIKVSLTALNKRCGESIDGPRDIRIREKPTENPCLTSAAEFVKKTNLTFEKIHQQPESQKFSKETIALISEIEKQFAGVDKETSAYINGDFNNVLVEMFTDSIYNNLLVASRNARMIEEKTALSFLTESHISLFYIIIKCQQADLINKSEKPFTTITGRITGLLQNYQKIQYQTDPKGTLKTFLTDQKIPFKDIKFILEAIDSQLKSLI